VKPLPPPCRSPLRARSVTAHALDCRPGTLVQRRRMPVAPVTPRTRERRLTKARSLADKQFSSSPNDEASFAISLPAQAHANDMALNSKLTCWQVALFAAAPVMSVDACCSAFLEEKVSPCKQANERTHFYEQNSVLKQTPARWPVAFAVIAMQVVAEFPATFRGHNTIFRIYGHRYLARSTLICNNKQS